MEKERIDVLAVKQGLFEIREQAKRSVTVGLIYDEKNERFDKLEEKIPVSSELRVKGKELPYVSQSGLRLEKALKAFDLSVEGKTLLDIGASTGEFTDAALQNGAEVSYVLDVGCNQLAWKIRQDPRVVVIERVNFRYARPEDFILEIPEAIATDVPFISLKLMLLPLHTILKEEGEVAALIKPQSEAGREAVGENGIVRDTQTHQKVLEDILSFAVQGGYDALGVSYSPIMGGEGNIEFLARLKKVPESGTINPAINMAEVVSSAHEQFDHKQIVTMKIK